MIRTAAAHVAQANPITKIAGVAAAAAAAYATAAYALGAHRLLGQVATAMIDAVAYWL